MIVPKRLTIHHPHHTEVLRSVLTLAWEFNALVVTFPNGWRVVEVAPGTPVACEDEVTG